MSLAAPRLGACRLVGAAVLLGRKPRKVLLGGLALAARRLALKLRLSVRGGVAARQHHKVAVLKRDAAAHERVEQLAVVAHEDADPAEPPERGGELGAGVHVEVVGGLVGHEHVWPAPERHGNLQLFALTAESSSKRQGMSSSRAKICRSSRASRP